jgi:hypothetical protein
MQFEIVGCQVSIDDGTALVTFKRRGDGKILRLKVKVQALSEVASLAQKGLVKQGNDRELGPTEVRGDLQNVAMCDPSGWRVGTIPMLSPPAVGLAFDLGTPWEIAYRFHPDYAERIGRELIETAAACRKPPSTAH